ncbi:unnamed protein product, partial [Symbiodinium necroappetens]
AAPFDLGTPHDNPHYEPYEFDNHLAWNEAKVPGIFLVGFLRVLVVTTVFLGEHSYFFCEFFGGFDGAFYDNFKDNDNSGLYYLNGYLKDNNSSGLYYLDTYHKDIVGNGVYYLDNYFEDFGDSDFGYIQNNENLTFFDNFGGFPFGKSTMTSSHGPGTGGGIPLHEFRKDTPPGWAPGLADYPLRLFFERLKLWYSIFDGDDTLVGPLVAGTLQGKAQRLGMQLRLVRPDGQYDVGSDALQRLSVEEVRDPNNPAVIIQHAIPSGVQALCNSLKDAFGMSDQEIVSRSIEDFFEFKRGKLSFQEYAIEWDIRLEEATTKAGLELNDVAKFYLFFRGSGLPQRFIEDIKLQLQGDLRRYVDARTIALRLITKKDDVGDSYYEEQQPEDLEDSSWDGYWTDDSWSWVEDYEPSEYYEDPWMESSYYEDEVYDWYDSEDHPSYVDESSADQGDLQEAGKGKGKGKGGKSKGLRKGSGKGYKGKSYGKRPSFGKSRGKGSWWPSKGYHGYAEHDCYGKTLSKSFGETTAIDMQPKAKTVHFQLDTEEAPILNLGRARHSDEPPRDGEGEPSSSSAPTARRLDLSFPTSIYSDHTTYHTVLGQKRRGLLVDPGAASGLFGSETLRDILESCLPSEKSATVSWNHDRSHSVSGINGTPEETLGEVSFPLTLAGASGSFSADVLGGEGSLCPALLSNPSLRKQKASLLLDYFANGDGVMVVSDGSDGWHYLRLLLTDSGHYLLPIDNHKAVSSETKTKVAAQLYTWSSEISQRWKDVRHCFLQHGQCRSSREHERSERHRDATTATHDNDNQSTIAKTSSTTSGNRYSSARDTTSTTTADANDNDNQDTIAKTSSTTSGFNGHRSSQTSRTTTTDLDNDYENKTSSTTSKDAGSNMVLTSGTTTLATANNHDNRDTIAKTSSTTSGRYFNDDAKHISGRVSQDAKHISGRSFLDGPSGERPTVQDSWRIDGEYLVRDHRVPRRALFVPGCTVDCPVPADRISEQRVTTLKAVARRAPPRFLEDDWRSSSTACKDMEYLWTGTTRFKLVPDRALDSSSSAPTVATDEATKEGSLDPSVFPCYGGDRYPSHWSDERCAKAERYYKSVPEEYYSRSGRRPITPDNIESWMSSASNRGLRFQAWEWFSRSGRLSLCLPLANIVVGPPIDYRYGWDVSYAPHQELLQKCQAEFQPVHLFASPSWNQWTEHSAVKDKHLRDVERRGDLPSLQYLGEVMNIQHLQNRGFTVEQPLGSAMFKESPLSRLRDLDGVRTARLDQCMFGAQDELLNPLRKATCLLTNRKWHRVLKRCGGHRGRAHGTATGRVHGCSRSDLATVFPKRLCQAQDFWVVFRSDSVDKLQAWPSFLFGTNQIFYSCERCQLGRAAPPGCEHTLVPGECRYGQPSMRASRARAAASTTEPTSSVPSPSSAPSAPADAPSAQPALRQQDLEDITGPFKFLARSGDYSRVQLEIHTSLTLDIEARLYLKAALMQLIESCLDIFSENTSRDLKHWLSDPILLRVFQDVFSEILNVLGVMVCLRPWNKQVPDPQLSSTVAPMRLLINGHIRSWYIGPLEDMRVLSHRQLHDPVDEADWHVYLFGVCHEDYDADRPLPPGTDPAVLPQAARPAAPLVPVEKKSVGKTQTPFQPPLQPPSADLDDAMEYQPSEAEAEEEFDPVRPDEDQDKILKPLFDFKKAELDRQGISNSINDLARECVMSHNNDCSGVTAIAGALQTDVTPFEKALRIRQLALSTVQKAVAEDRIARANRTRTQQLELGELVPGVTRVDFHRETQGDVGWRGPAELLKVNTEEGTAIISYQGRPHLVSLRHIRPHQAGVFVVISENQEASFLELQRIAEQVSPYNAVTIGWVPLSKNGVTTWTRASTTSLSYQDTWPKIVSLARALSRYNVGGAIVGQGDKKYSCHEHNNDQPIVLKKITASPIESTVFMYIYYFVNVDYRPQEEMKVVPSEGATEQATDHNMDATPAPTDGIGNEDVTIGSRDPGSSIEAPSPMEEDNLPEDRKRKGPESRTVVIGPESKRTKVCSLVHLMNSEKVHHRAQHVMINLYWIMHWTQAIPMSFPMTWYGMDNNVPVALWDIFMSRSSSGTCDNPSPSRPGYLFTWPGKKHEELYASLDTGTTTFRNEENHPIIMRSLPIIANIEEKHFDLSDKELIKEITKNFATRFSIFDNHHDGYYIHK